MANHWCKKSTSSNYVKNNAKWENMTISYQRHLSKSNNMEYTENSQKNKIGKGIY